MKEYKDPGGDDGMIIKSYSQLDSDTIQKIRQLESVCKQHDELTGEVFLDSSMNFNTEMNHTFLCYEKDDLVGFLHLFVPTAAEAEISAYIRPDLRGLGYFTALLLKAEEELDKFAIADILFVIESESGTGKKIADHLGAVNDFTEYSLVCEDSLVPAPDEENTAVRLYRPGIGDVDDLVRIGRSAFGGSEEEERSMAEKSLRSETRAGYAAVLNDQLIGIGYADSEEKDPTVFGLGILPEFQGKGYGKAFLSLIMHDLLSAGAQKMKIEVESTNIRALRLYENLGFHVVRAYEYYRMPVQQLQSN